MDELRRIWKRGLLILITVPFAFGMISVPFSVKAASGNQYYVAPNGDDSNPGTIEEPWRTLAPVNAQDFLPGDMIHFKRGGVWSGWWVIDDSGVQDNPITFTAYGTGDRPVFTNPGGAGSDTRVIMINADWVVVEGFLIQDSHAEGIYISNGSDHNVIHDIEATNVGIGVAIHGQHNFVTRNHVHDLHMVVNTQGGDDDWGAVGIWLFNSNNEVSYNRIENCKASSYDYGVDGGAIEWTGFADNNYVHHNLATGSDGFLEVSAGSARDTIVAYNVSVNNGRFSWIHLSGPFASDVVNFQLDNNTIVENALPGQSWVVIGFRGDPIAITFQMRNNVLWIEKGGDFFHHISNKSGFTHQNNLYHLIGEITLGFNLGQGELVANPLFTDLEVRDFHLQAGSPAIDNGTDLGYPLDFDDLPVPFGSAPDMGAFEYQTVEPTSTPVPSQTSLPPSPTQTPSPTPTTTNTPTLTSTPISTPSITPIYTHTLTPSKTPSSTPLPADLNGDGRVDVLDTQLCVNVVLGTETDPIIVAYADVNTDGVVNVLDVQEIVNVMLAI